ncbi:flagellar biosynthetic protein FliR [Rhodocaloribacter litoris]|uniref:flagellar biosynthetic protein FliR n=1 Tax=Rhodocaloribacter litoris TaxID=2558931 RepID=UPI00141DE908|nr:flagellar biosynthetic protein FliR [Rhodocaloribacter litoris]QXD16066.1 flagellar biosynthetic protein FliR [Rhodocaloribacter litoris]
MSYLDPAYYLGVFLVFVRIGGLLMAAPFFGQPSVPVRLRVLIAVMMAYLLVGFTPAPLPESVFHPFGLMVAVGIEALTGVVLGLASQFIFWALQYAGDVLGFQMGLSLAEVFNPADGQSTNPMGRLFLMTFLLVFILLDGPHYLLYALIASFDVVPLGGAGLAAAGPLMLDWAGRLFATALRLAAPFMMTFFLVEAALGIFARVVPQADLFSLSLPLKLLLGLGLGYLFLQNLFPIIPGFIDQMYDDLLTLVEALAATGP